MEINDIAGAIEAILFASGDPMPAARIAQVLGIEEQKVFETAAMLQEEYKASFRGIRLLRLDNKLQLCSAPEYAQSVKHALEQRKMPKLTPAALEVLAIVAYFQPVTRAYIDQVRGVDSSYTVGVLAERGLIEAAGKLDVPGRPTLFRTGDTFLRTMGISELSELPKLPDISTDEGIIALQESIDSLRTAEVAGQISLDDGE
ncbi:MAG: SMC-Scp complex subunit ScpB [Oscillospiraceae bacterium]|nr:SMC-Scp complex subunit ScpB [Oscillospiraceae bacterium]